MCLENRTQLLKSWLGGLYPGQVDTFELLKGDASFRRYFRLKLKPNRENQQQLSFIVMDAPPQKEPLAPFIKTTNKLASISVPVPHIYHQNMELGGLVLQDFGDVDYLSALRQESPDQLYRLAIDNLVTIQKLPMTELPSFDVKQITQELDLFKHWYLVEHCKLKNISLTHTYDYLIEACQNQPYVTTHRDYHSRNLMLRDNNALGILDHQDLMQGPITYDLVSLLKDCYIDWPADQVTEWVDYYLNLAQIDNQPTFLRDFNLTGVQRHMKAIGIFARLAYLYNNPNYLKYIPRTLKYISIIADNDPNLDELCKLISI